MPQISVIVPVYKVEPYLRRCVDSILTQTFRNFELILVDDGSPDNCPAICDEYAAKDSRVRVLHQANRGASAARNAGIDTAQGDYICFIDSDDIVSPDYCEYLLWLLTHYNADFSVIESVRFHSEENICIEERSEKIHHISSLDFFLNQLTPATEIGTWNKMFRKEIIDKIRYVEEKVHEDILFSVDLVPLCKNGVVWSNQVKYFYRQNPQGVTSGQHTRCSPDFIFAAKHVIALGHRYNSDVLNRCVYYAISNPWSYIDGIYVHRDFYNNKTFIADFRQLIKSNLETICQLKTVSRIQKKRMQLFARSPILYGFNAYARLLRVYLYRILHLDAYADGHGI